MLSEMDPPQHTHYRHIIRGPFSPAKTAQRAEFFRATTNELIDAFIADGQVDAARLANEIPGRMTAIMLGHAARRRGSLPGVDARIARGFADPEGTAAEREDLDAYFDELLASRGSPRRSSRVSG